MVGIPIRCDIWQGVAVVGLMVGKAQQWDQLVRHRVTLDHHQQAAIRYIWSQTFPESGNLSPVRGRFGRTVPQGAEQDKPGSCLSGCCLASHWHGSLCPGPQLRVRGRAVVRNIWASSEQGCCLIVSSEEPLSGLALRLAIDQP